mgnify:CR=1 FL=1
MKKILLSLIIISMFSFMNKTFAKYEKIFFDFNIKSIDGNNLELSTYKNKAILLVNVASNCGFTKQYGGLQLLWEKYSERGLTILAVPSNDFHQEPGDNEAIKEFCEINYGITFPIMAKVNVKGNNKHPFFLWVENNYGSKNLPKWNFFKYLVSKNGELINVYSSRIKPSSDEFNRVIEENL